MNVERVNKARAEDMREFKKHGVYTKVPIEECMRETGNKPIGHRWVDIDKGDRNNPNYRSRLVAKEINVCRRDDLFAATPPWEQLKMLIALFMTVRVVIQGDK